MTSELHLTIHTDGGARGNPGPAAIGVVIAEAGHVVRSIGRTIGSTTNNQAEYQAIIAALEDAQERRPTHVDIYSDSELIVKQLRGEYRVKNAELAPLFLRATSLMNALKSVTLHVVRREQNTKADDLVNRALDGEPTER